ncbi:MAG TPA: gliding motility-associated C-terminal domain-containing protein [Bacteroidales bacterium]|nr:gliding motility-associated C-terminal domain-containing protein [Bacteroidales bacterium]
MKQQHLRRIVFICCVAIFILAGRGSAVAQSGFLGPDRSICRNDSTVIEAPLAFSYLWSTGQTTRFIVARPAVTTDYWVSITNFQGQTQRDTIRVNVLPLPNVLVNPSLSNLLPGEAVLLTASGAQSYAWTNGPNTATYFVQPHLPQNVYTVKGIGSNGCANTASAIVNVVYTTNPSFEYTKTCIGDTTRFTAKIQTNDTIISVLWDLDGNLQFDNGTGLTGKFLYNSPGERLAGIRVVTKHSPTPHSVYLPVVVGDFPVVRFVNMTACTGSPTRFTDQTTMMVGFPEKWNWTIGQSSYTTQHPDHTFTQPGQMQAKLKVTTTEGCTDSLVRQINVLNPPSFSLQHQDGKPFESPYTKYRFDTVRLRVSGTMDSAIWNNKVKSLNYATTLPGNYSVKAYRLGCQAQKNFVILQSEFDYDPGFKIQNILTPNGDGYNDVWKIDILNSIRPARVTIYSRSGLKVFETSNYNNNWDGTYNGNPLPEGSYFYVIEGARGETFKGTITLLR